MASISDAKSSLLRGPRKPPDKQRSEKERSVKSARDKSLKSRIDKEKSVRSRRDKDKSAREKSTKDKSKKPKSIIEKLTSKTEHLPSTQVASSNVRDVSDRARISEGDRARMLQNYARAINRGNQPQRQRQTMFSARQQIPRSRRQNNAETQAERARQKRRSIIAFVLLAIAFVVVIIVIGVLMDVYLFNYDDHTHSIHTNDTGIRSNSSTKTSENSNIGFGTTKISFNASELRSTGASTIRPSETQKSTRRTTSGNTKLTTITATTPTTTTTTTTPTPTTTTIPTTPTTTTIPTTTTTTTTTTTSSQFYTKSRGQKTYYFEEGDHVSMDYEAAREYCYDKWAAKLVLPTNSEENDFIGKTLRDRWPKKVDSIDEFNGFWIDATDKKQEGKFITNSGSRIGFTKWGAGEPNNNKGLGEDCIQVHPKNGYIWNDLACSYKKNPFIVCEY